MDRSVFESDARVDVSVDDRTLAFLPRDGDTLPGVVFIPGGLVAPKAYAPLLRRIADAGRAETVRRVLAVLAERPADPDDGPSP